MPRSPWRMGMSGVLALAGIALFSYGAYGAVLAFSSGPPEQALTEDNYAEELGAAAFVGAARFASVATAAVGAVLLVVAVHVYSGRRRTSQGTTSFTRNGSRPAP